MPEDDSVLIFRLQSAILKIDKPTD